MVGPLVARPLGLEGAPLRAKGTALNRQLRRRRPLTLARPHGHHPAHGLAAVQGALRAADDLEAVGSRQTRPAEKHGVVSVRVVQAQTIDEKQRLVGIGAAQEERGGRTTSAGGKQRHTRRSAQGRAQRADLLARKFFAGDEIDAAAQHPSGQRRAGRRHHDRAQRHGLFARLRRHEAGRDHQERGQGGRDHGNERPALQRRREPDVHLCSFRLRGKSRNVGTVADRSFLPARQHPSLPLSPFIDPDRIGIVCDEGFSPARALAPAQ